ncbi:hypothetical protein GAYE_SCF28MG4735 [Galdieria yellowstonensis]|uniref:Nucleoside diphosphate kinase n=1 Tax=Galdieria yellowstonensis TaxID=3028027 RepID=A0AAV9IHH7_9RHOD|nr:hypothetical protein GAYE_SCF28MG4735 [Galdieria yellowstonensis]
MTPAFLQSGLLHSSRTKQQKVKWIQTHKLASLPCCHSTRRSYFLRWSMHCSERTFVAIKPDGVHRGLMGRIIARLEDKGYSIVALKLIKPSKTLAESHYEALQSKPFFADLVAFITSGPVCAMVWEGKDVVAQVRKLIGNTDPLTSAPGTIRGDFGVDIGRNIIHASDSISSAKREIELWFHTQDLIEWNPTLHEWIYEKV